MSLSAFFVLLISFSVSGQDAKKDKKGLPTNRFDIAKLQTNMVMAKVVAEATEKSIIVQIPFNKDAKTPQGQIRQVADVNALRLITEWKELEVPINEKTKFRFKDPVEAFDDKGNIKKYTAAELANLKGPDTKLPGYLATAENIIQGHLVQINLVRSTNKDEKKPFAIMIMVLGKEGLDKENSPPDNKKKKK